MPASPSASFEVKTKAATLSLQSPPPWYHIIRTSASPDCSRESVSFWLSFLSKGNRSGWIAQSIGQGLHQQRPHCWHHHTTRQARAAISCFFPTRRHADSRIAIVQAQESASIGLAALDSYAFIVAITTGSRPLPLRDHDMRWLK